VISDRACTDNHVPHIEDNKQIQGKKSKRNHQSKHKHSEVNVNKKSHQEPLFNDNENVSASKDRKVPQTQLKDVASYELSTVAQTAELEDLSDSSEGADPSGGEYTHPNIKLKSIKWCPTCQCCHKTNTCFLVIYLWIGLLLTACVVALIAVSFLVVRPYMKADRFVETECKAIAVAYSSVDHDCSCGKGCTSVFPCLEVVVEFSSQDNQSHRAFLREHEAVLSSKVCIHHFKCLLECYRLKQILYLPRSVCLNCVLV
jgi:hypothetical protein